MKLNEGEIIDISFNGVFDLTENKKWLYRGG